MISIPIKRGEFVALFAGNGTVVAPNTMNLLLTPPIGQRARLTHLSTTAGVNQSSISIFLGTVTVLSSKTINGGSPVASSNSFSIGSYQPYGAGSPPSGNHPFITGKTDEVINITSSGALSNTIYYAYEFGE